MKELDQYVKSLNAELKTLCDKKAFAGQTEEAERLLTGGADAERGLKDAVKNYNFPLVKLLIACGATQSPSGKRLLSAMCNFGRFTPARESAFFELIDFSLSLTGFDIEYFIPFVNNSLLEGKLSKLYEILRRYNISDGEAASVVNTRVIFEIISRGGRSALSFIETYNDWMEGALDTAVATGNDLVLNYILLSRDGLRPSKDAIARAVYEGKTDVLTLLLYYGISFNDEIYIKNACKAYPKSKAGLEFLFLHGLPLSARYGGKTLLENAVDDNNAELTALLEQNLSRI